ATSMVNPTPPAPAQRATRCTPPNCWPASTTPSVSTPTPSSTTTSTNRASWSKRSPTPPSSLKRIPQLQQNLFVGNREEVLLFREATASLPLSFKRVPPPYFAGAAEASFAFVSAQFLFGNASHTRKFLNDTDC